ncbi:PEP/pyruvate-binding domain-containing protein [Nocardiopsis aegyptia]|uniref:Pyruvate,water dikinase n=1 Tax=Nocardiopsis aegyptia TaxID=220378 RepID=A0A7Z0JA63_9ACTN|nr:PEP/pyruvate-binding domain-containing protein [Nocardiopsis aegyptia]NYJ34786.1 pyruvate,water dikinase [Nocardiopsis aegyptia]
MRIVALNGISADMIDQVGGKATGLGAMVAIGERVPPGFCLTTEAHASREIPEADLAAAYDDLGGGRVAVRSSATAEDLPDASFAGQQDTVLDVEGTDALVAAVRRCWDSLDSERAVAYREAAGIDRESVGMAVVVQRMVDAEVAGVLFTADPMTGCRTTMVVDAAPGLGTTVVDGSGPVDHYVLPQDAPVDGPPDGCLTSERLEELRAAGRRLQKHFGTPQDVEWAFDGDGVLWLLQSRAITTLFPEPPRTPDTRMYLELGHIQGMLRPFTPMGLSLMSQVWVRWCERMRIPVDPGAAFGIVGIGGRLFVDITAFMRDPRIRHWLPQGMDVYGPRVRAAVERMLDDPRFAPLPPKPLPVRTALGVAARTAPMFVGGLIGSLARPGASRADAWAAVRHMRTHRVPGATATTGERLRFVTEEGYDDILGTDMIRATMPTMAGILLTVLPSALLHGVASEEELDHVLGGMPHNVTTQMDLALWRLAEHAREHGDLFADTDPAELAARHRAGTLPDIGLAEFLADYGHRAAAEVDIGVPRWAEDPAPVFATIANYLRIDDPEQSPARRFERSAVRARRAVTELSLRGRARRPVRGRIAAVAMRRSRELAGMREFAKFAWLVPYARMREQLLLVGADLAERRLLDRADDIVFLDVDEARAAVHEGVDQRALAAERRAVHARETRRRTVPGALLSDGTDVETLIPAEPAPEDALSGLAAASGRVTGRARVVHDPAGARIEPGEILVAPTTDPGWTPLFMTAGGLVTETGSTVAHGPTVAREYGIPAVICVRHATREIATGDLITVDGSAGTVVFEEKDGGPDMDMDTDTDTGTGADAGAGARPDADTDADARPDGDPGSGS